jgi:hypothetical protein
MSDQPPIHLDPWHTIVDVHWDSAPIGVLVVDMPDSVATHLRLDPSRSFMNGNSAGDVIERADLATFDDSDGTHPAPVSYFVFNSAEPLVLSSLYGAGSKKYWEIEVQKVQPGPDPGDPRNTTFGPSPHDLWVRYKETDTLNYDSQKEAYSTPPYRWIEVNDLRSLGADTLLGRHGGVGPFRTGETWQNFDYGFWGATSHYVFNASGYAVSVTGDPDIPMYNGMQQFDSFLPAIQVGWGMGERQHSTGPGSNLVRHIYFIDFKILGSKEDVGDTALTTTGDVLPGGLEIGSLTDTWLLIEDRNYSINGEGITAGTRFTYTGGGSGTLDKKAKPAIGIELTIGQDHVYISNNLPIFDSVLGEYDMTFDLAIYPGSAKFTITEDSVTADLKAVVASVQKTASYYQDGALFELGRKGWI